MAVSWSPLTMHIPKVEGNFIPMCQIEVMALEAINGGHPKIMLYAARQSITTNSSILETVHDSSPNVTTILIVLMAVVPSPENPYRVIEVAFKSVTNNPIFFDIKGIVFALQKIKEKAHKDGQKKNEETISSVAVEIKSMIDELKSKFDKDRQGFSKAFSKSSKEFENCLKKETSKFQTLCQQFCKEKEIYLQLSDTISKFEEEKERLLKRFEQMRKKEKSMMSEHEKACGDKITRLEESLKRKTQDDKTFRILRKTLGSLFENASDEDFPPND
ncbi:uncharacterized protein LOC133791728 [Humulus lupulus]|uniref:uncharacterized protein LOC133791728 n=1 Tax=Humulus lupulus TaxID=3486 RepID=UPI002B4149F1|nr:uncharacterized protein LOC133791728 [Humulus lupulus]